MEEPAPSEKASLSDSDPLKCVKPQISWRTQKNKDRIIAARGVRLTMSILIAGSGDSWVLTSRGMRFDRTRKP